MKNILAIYHKNFLAINIFQRDALSEFLDWLEEKEDVFFVTGTQVIASQSLWELKHISFFSGASLDDRSKAFEPDKVSGNLRSSYCWQKKLCKNHDNDCAKCLIKNYFSVKLSRGNVRLRRSFPRLHAQGFCLFVLFSFFLLLSVCLLFLVCLHIQQLISLLFFSTKKYQMSNHKASQNHISSMIS